MDNNTQTKSEPGLASLLSGIVNDIQTLVKQQLALFRQEVKEDLNKAKEGGTLLAIGSGLGLVGVLLLCLALAHLLNWAAPEMPLWCCYGIVGVVVASAAGIMVYQARAQFSALEHPLDKTTEALEENLEWKTTPK